MNDDIDYDQSMYNDDEETSDNEEIEGIGELSNISNKQPTRQKIEQFWEMYELNKQINGDIYTESFADG